MEAYFNYNGYKVVSYKDKSFAKYTIEDSRGRNYIRCFNDLDEAIVYCIGVAVGNVSDNNLMIHVDTFLTMIKKGKV